MKRGWETWFSLRKRRVSVDLIAISKYLTKTAEKKPDSSWRCTVEEAWKQVWTWSLMVHFELKDICFICTESNMKTHDTVFWSFLTLKQHFNASLFCLVFPLGDKEQHKISDIFYRDWSKSGWQNPEYFSLSLSSFSVASTQSRQLYYLAKLATEVKF